MKIIGPHILISSFYQVKCFFLIQNFRTVTLSQIRVKWSEERQRETGKNANGFCKHIRSNANNEDDL